MFKSLVWPAAALILGAALSSPADAQSFSPAPGSYVFSGQIDIASTWATTCEVEMDVSVDALGAATVTSVTLSGGLGCGSTVLPFGTWAIAPGPGLYAVTMTLGFWPAHNCYGVLEALLTVTSSRARIDFPFTFLPRPSTSQNGCAVMGGALYSDGPFEIVP